MENANLFRESGLDKSKRMVAGEMIIKLFRGSVRSSRLGFGTRYDPAAAHGRGCTAVPAVGLRKCMINTLVNRIYISAQRTVVSSLAPAGHATHHPKPAQGNRHSTSTVHAAMHSASHPLDFKMDRGL